MKKIYRVILPLLILLCFSCKKEIPVSPGFELSASPENNTVVLNWSPVYLSGFKSIAIYRSVSPIPDPLFNKPIDASLLIGTVTDKTITTFKDTNMVLGSNGAIYYKVVMNLADRVIPSNEVQTSLDGFSFAFNSNGFAGNTRVMPLSERNLLYLIDNSSNVVRVIDYSEKKIVKSAFISQMSNKIYPFNNSGNAELLVLNSLSITAYDGLTLTNKYTINVPAYSVNDFMVKDNYMYVLYMTNYYTVKIRTYDLSTQLVVSDKTVYSKINYGPSNPTLYYGSQTNKLFFKYYTQNYNSQGNYVYRNYCVNYNIVNYIPTDSVVITNSILSKDSLGNNNFYYIQPSPDGKYLTCNAKGDILSLSDNSLHNVQSGTNFNPQIAYSNTGNYLLAKPSNSGGISSNLIDVFSLPNFNLVASIKSPNPPFSQSSSSMIKDDFLDNDSLVSYNLKHTFLNNQTKSVLTVFFKKIN